MRARSNSSDRTAWVLSVASATVSAASARRSAWSGWPSTSIASRDDDVALDDLALQSERLEVGAARPREALGLLRATGRAAARPNSRWVDAATRCCQRLEHRQRGTQHRLGLRGAPRWSGEVGLVVLGARGLERRTGSPRHLLGLGSAPGPPQRQPSSAASHAEVDQRARLPDEAAVAERRQRQLAVGTRRMLAQHDVERVKSASCIRLRERVADASRVDLRAVAPLQPWVARPRREAPRVQRLDLGALGSQSDSGSESPASSRVVMVRDRVRMA